MWCLFLGCVEGRERWRQGGPGQPLTSLSHWQIHMKTMPAAMFRLLTGQETPLYI